MLQIKMCGMTRPEDAAMAAEIGADAIGLVFHPQSPRHLSCEEAASVAHAVPRNVARVGVFVDADAESILQYVKAANLTAVQLHGDESPELVDQLAKSIPVIKALSYQLDLAARLSRYGDHAILLDAAAGAIRGGTGFSWDWKQITFQPRPRYFILAGGLTPENVAAAVAQLGPDAVDVSSGIESSPGIKDPAKMEAFVAACDSYRIERRAFLS